MCVCVYIVSPNCYAVFFLNIKICSTFDINENLHSLDVKTSNISLLTYQTNICCQVPCRYRLLTIAVNFTNSQASTSSAPSSNTFETHRRTTSFKPEHINFYIVLDIHDDQRRTHQYLYRPHVLCSDDIILVLISPQAPKSMNLYI